MPHQILKLSKCKSHAHRRAKAEARGTSPRESTSYPVWCSRPDCFSTRSQDGCTTFLPVSVADLERHRSRKSDHVGAHPTEGSISNTLHIVTAAFLVVNEAVPVRLRLWEPFHHRAQGKEPSQRSATPHYPVQAWGARPLFIGYERASSTRLPWKQE